jgi:hypothetical protein
MPDHLHIVAVALDPDLELRKLRAVIGVARRRAGGSPYWRPPPAPHVIPDTKHLLRQIRYVALNPCREGLVNDPLAWPWSTYRGTLGAELNPWISAKRLFDAIGWGGDSLENRQGFHSYVSADPSVDVRGSPFPCEAKQTIISRFPLEHIMAASIAATPLAGVRGLRRRTFVALAHDQGWHDHVQLARAAGIQGDSASRISREVPRKAFRAAAICLGDDRLLTGYLSAASRNVLALWTNAAPLSPKDVVRAHPRLRASAETSEMASKRA